MDIIQFLIAKKVINSFGKIPPSPIKHPCNAALDAIIMYLIIQNK